MTKHWLHQGFSLSESFFGLWLLHNESKTFLKFIARGIQIIIIKQNLDISQHDMNSKIIITLFSLFTELERDMISLRTKEALRSKRAQGITLGKPKGILQKSKFDKDVEKIKELLGYGLSGRKIATVLGYTSHIALNTYINKRGLWPGHPINN